MIYIKENQYFKFDFELNPLKYNVGFTYTDSLNGFFVKLNEAQIIFKNKYPNASVEEVWDTKFLSEPLIDIDLIRNTIINNARTYSSSSIVKAFKVNDRTYWLNSLTRLQLFHTFHLCKKYNNNTVILWLGSDQYQLNVDSAINILEKLELYSYLCFLVCLKHIVNIEKLKTKEEIELYDYKKGYPSVLKFDL